MEEMNAIIWTAYGGSDVLQLQKVEKPQPKADEILVKVRTTTVGAWDCEMRNLQFPFLFRIMLRLFNGIKAPKRIRVLGQEFAGDIVEIGEQIYSYKIGDAIFGTPNFTMSTHAEYLILKETESTIALKPANMTYAEATTIPVGGLNALYFLRKAHLQPGQKLLIIGAGGSIGTLAVQLGKYYGVDITAVDSTEKLAMLRTLGTDYTIDFTREDIFTPSLSYDVIFDVAGKNSLIKALKVLEPKGIYLMGNPKTGWRILGKILALIMNKRVITSSASYSHEDLHFLKTLIEDGKLQAVIDKFYSLNEVAQAHDYIEAGKRKGNVVINIEHIS